MYSIILYIPTLSCGGAERVALILSASLINMNHRVRLVVCDIRGEFAQLVPDGVELINLNCSKPIKSICALASVINSFHTDAVICFGMHTGIATALSKVLFKWPAKILIRNENNLDFEWVNATFINRIIGPRLSRWAARKSIIISVSESLRIPTASYLNISKEMIKTIPNPVFNHIDDFYTEDQPLLHEWFSNMNAPIIVAVGRLEQQKGFDILISAFAYLQDMLPCKLIIYGNGSLRNSLLDQIIQLGLEDNVDLAGYTSNPFAQIRAASVFVLSSRYEGFGLVLVEALASGTQIVSTDCNYGPCEILEGGRYGTLVPVEDPKSMASALYKILTGEIKTESPTHEWFSKYSANLAARRHLDLI